MAYSAAIRAVSSGVGLSKSTQKGFVLSELVASLATVVWIVSIRPAQIAKTGIGIDTDTKAGHSQLPRMRSDAPARLIVPPVLTPSGRWRVAPFGQFSLYNRQSSVGLSLMLDNHCARGLLARSMSIRRVLGSCSHTANSANKLSVLLRTVSERRSYGGVVAILVDMSEP